MTRSPEAIRLLAEAAVHQRLRALPLDRLREAHRVLADRAIEIAEVASQAPGEYEHPGASPKQLAFAEDFFSTDRMIYAADGGNRCLAAGTEVSTPDGPKAIEKLREGDAVLLPSGAPTRVVRVYENGLQLCRVWSSEIGNVPLVTCTDDHKVALVSGAMRRIGSVGRRVLSLTEGPNRRLSPWIITDYYRGDVSVIPTTAYFRLPTYDIEVEDESHRFLLESGLTVSNSGKTTCLGGMCFCRYVRDHARDGEQFWVIAQSAQTWRDVPAKTLWKFLPRSMFEEGIRYHPKLGFGQINTLKLTLLGGRGNCEIHEKTAEMSRDKLEASRVRLIWWTECQDEWILDSIMPRLADSGGKVLMDFIAEQSWHIERIEEAAKTNPNILHVLFTMLDNRHNMPKGAIERMELSPEAYELRVLGKPRAARGVVYPEFRADLHVMEPITVPVGVPTWWGMDYGHPSPTAIISGWIQPEGSELAGVGKLSADTLVVFYESYHRERALPSAATELLELLRQYAWADDLAIDPAAFNRLPTGDSVAQQLMDIGVPICDLSSIMRDSGMRLRGSIALVRSWLLSRRILIFSSCVNLIREFRVWRYKEAADGTPTDVPEDRNDHALDALRYIIVRDPGPEALNIEVRTRSMPNIGQVIHPDFGTREGRPYSAVEPSYA